MNMIPASAFGHGDFMMIRAELVREVGGPGKALLAALIFWRTSPNYRDSYERDGKRWWNASREELAEATGMTVDQVRTAGKSLTEGGFIEAVQHQLAGEWDRSFSYRVVTDTPIWDEAQMQVGSVPQTSGEDPKSSSMKTVKTTTTARTRMTQMPSDLAWDNGHSMKAMARGVDVEVEFEKFKDYHLARASKFADWSKAFHTWLNNAHPEHVRRQTTNTHRTPTDRMNDVLAIQDPREMGMLE